MISRELLLEKFNKVRSTSMKLVAQLQPEEFRIQSMTDVSPPWWNIGHTSWFFAKNVLEPNGLFNDEDRRLEYVLNSYYIALGPRQPRAQRGDLSRPTTPEIFDYRASVDKRIIDFIDNVDEEIYLQFAEIILVGLNHEQQHQELFLTEIKHIYAAHPPELRPIYSTSKIPSALGKPIEKKWLKFDAGLFEFGGDDNEWRWDNEKPIHKRYLESFALADRLVTNGEYLEFIRDGGYDNALLWLDNGFTAKTASDWHAPLYWEGASRLWTLIGYREINDNEPVCHVSFFEADAFARWRSMNFSKERDVRLPTEFEWEHALKEHFSGENSRMLDQGNLMDSGIYHPAEAVLGEGLKQMIGDVWEWTSDAYRPYPGFKPFDGNLAEYNGKFMDGQYVLRGGSTATPNDHIRSTYRNFWHPATRFQFSGIRLARSI